MLRIQKIEINCKTPYCVKCESLLCQCFAEAGGLLFQRNEPEIMDKQHSRWHFLEIQAHESQRLISDSTAFSVLPVQRYGSKSPITTRIIVRDQGRVLSSVVLPVHNTGVRTAAQQGHGPKFCCLQTTTGSFDWGLYVTRQHCFAIDVGATVIRSFSHATGVTWSLVVRVLSSTVRSAMQPASQRT